MSALELHHVNLSSPVVPAMDAFYRGVLGLQPLTAGPAASRILETEGYSAPVSFFKSNGIELHVATMDLDVSFRMGQAINPLINGHIAFRTDDIGALKKRLDSHGIRYSDYGVWSIAGWHQVFFHDPAGNVVEVHQVIS